MTAARCAKAHGVLILENELNVGGLERKLHDLVSHLDKRHFRVVMGCLKAAGDLKEAFLALDVPLYENLTAHKYDALVIGRLLGILRKEKIDLLYTTHHPNTIILADMAKRLGRVKHTVLSIHASSNPAGGRVLPAYLKPFLGKFDSYVAVADTHKQRLVEREGLDASKFKVIYNGVDSDKFCPGAPIDKLRSALGIQPGEKVVTTVASLSYRKGIDTLLQSAATILSARKGVRFLIVGDGPGREEYEKMAGDLGIAGQVTFAGLRDDVADVLRLSDAFVLPSRNSEAFPNVVLEALSTELPVVATDVGSVREIIEDGERGVVLPPDDAGRLSGAITALLEDEARSREFGRLGREFVKKTYHLDSMVTGRVRLFESILCRT